MFHVPELSRGSRMVHAALAGTASDGNNGSFDLPSPEPGWRLACLASDGEGWEHVSIHAYSDRRQRVPTWKEMTYAKRLFWDSDDVVMQLHPKESDYVNCHPFVLHLWRPIAQVIPHPPVWMVGPLSATGVGAVAVTE